jgi:signal transduction histidine kinase
VIQHSRLHGWRGRTASIARCAAGVGLVVVFAAVAELAAHAGWAAWAHFTLLGVLSVGAVILIRRLQEREARLERRSSELAAVLHSTDNGICLADNEGRIVFANMAMDRLWAELGLPTHGTVWDRLGALALKTDRQEQLLVAFSRLADEPRLELEQEAEVVSVGRSFVGRTVPVVDGGGRLLGRVFTLRETTAERTSERLKDELVATVSHELRTPLTSAIGFLDVVLERECGPLTEQQREFLTIARSSAERLVRLVGDLLSAAEVEAGTLSLEPDAVHVDDVAAACVADLGGVAEGQGVRLRLERRRVPALWADADRLRQLMDNLVTNAIKFTPPGGDVVVRTDSERGRAVFEVEDSGIGIPSAEMDRIFHRFFRASTAVERQVPGTGLGLRICKAIVDAHDGTIRVRSDEGRGATFRVELPLRAAPVALRSKVA